MRICIVSLNSQYIHSSLAPWCLLAGFHEYGDARLQPTIIEGTVNEPLSGIFDRILKEKPQVVGLSCYIWNVEYMLQLAKMIKYHLPDCFVVLGGPEVSYRAWNAMRQFYMADYIIVGEGERAFPCLCVALLERKEPVVPGVGRRVGGRIVVEPPEELENPPSPYGREYFSALMGRIAYLETSRGCPYSCAYCLSSQCGKLKFYSMDRAKAEILRLANSGTKTIKFVDRTFNADRQRAKELWRFIIEKAGNEIPNGVCFHFEIAGDLLDEESIELLHTAPVGLMQFELGIQSFHPPTLTYINRKTNLNLLCHNIHRLLEKQNFHVHVDLIAGLPLEDFDTFCNSINKAYALQSHMLQIGFLKLLPGSPMRVDYHAYPCEYSELPPYEVITTPVLSATELQRLHKAEWALERLYNSGRFGRSLQYVLSVTELPPAELFLRFGEQAMVPDGASLDQLAEAFYGFAVGWGADANVLRNHMVCDRLETVRGGHLPAFLQVKDDRLATFRRTLRQNSALAPKNHVPRGSALLYEPLRGVYVDYNESHPVTEKYELHFIEME